MELAELIVPGDGGTEQPLKRWPDDELKTESAELPVHGTDGTLKYLMGIREISFVDKRSIKNRKNSPGHFIIYWT